MNKVRHKRDRNCRAGGCCASYDDDIDEAAVLGSAGAASAV